MSISVSVLLLIIFKTTKVTKVPEKLAASVIRKEWFSYSASFKVFHCHFSFRDKTRKSALRNKLSTDSEEENESSKN